MEFQKLLTARMTVLGLSLSNLIFFGERSLVPALKQYIIHYHEERNHQGKSNVLLFPSFSHNPQRKDTTIECRERLNGMPKYYYRKAA